ncbi:hypothetical protein C8R45DRAFT_946486 [Mycena sanguinolenta]|nr:hypothetical protein C8R45DRAFT_946486 [Mycena sanguinolenta]
MASVSHRLRDTSARQKIQKESGADAQMCKAAPEGWRYMNCARSRSVGVLGAAVANRTRTARSPVAAHEHSHEERAHPPSNVSPDVEANERNRRGEKEKESGAKSRRKGPTKTEGVEQQGRKKERMLRRTNALDSPRGQRCEWIAPVYVRNTVSREAWGGGEMKGTKEGKRGPKDECGIGRMKRKSQGGRAHELHADGRSSRDRKRMHTAKAERGKTEGNRVKENQERKANKNRGRRKQGRKKGNWEEKSRVDCYFLRGKAGGGSRSAEEHMNCTRSNAPIHTEKQTKVERGKKEGKREKEHRQGKGKKKRDGEKQERKEKSTKMQQPYSEIDSPDRRGKGTKEVGRDETNGFGQDTRDLTRSKDGGTEEQPSAKNGRNESKTSPCTNSKFRTAERLFEIENKCARLERSSGVIQQIDNSEILDADVRKDGSADEDLKTGWEEAGVCKRKEEPRRGQRSHLQRKKGGRALNTHRTLRIILPLPYDQDAKVQSAQRSRYECEGKMREKQHAHEPPVEVKALGHACARWPWPHDEETAASREFFLVCGWQQDVVSRRKDASGEEKSHEDRKYVPASHVVSVTGIDETRKFRKEINADVQEQAVHELRARSNNVSWEGKANGQVGRDETGKGNRRVSEKGQEGRKQNGRKGQGSGGKGKAEGKGNAVPARIPRLF